MASKTIDDARIRWHREDDERSSVGAGGEQFVLYWMQQAQRATGNHALEFAIQQANDMGVPAAVVFCVETDYPDASARHFAFMLEGLHHTANDLERRGVAFEMFVASAADVLAAVGHRCRLLVMDRGYLPIQRSWRDDVVDSFEGPIAEIETDVVVPTDLVSDKMETAARTIRPKIHEHLERFLVELDTTALERSSISGGDSPVSLARTATDLTSLDIGDWERELSSLDVAAEPARVEGWSPGPSGATSRLRAFCEDVLPDYDELRNRFDLDDSSSRLSPYLHYGQISPVDVVLGVKNADAPDDDKDSMIEELVVRRELAMNHALHNPDFDSFAGLPDWARETLRDHEDDERADVYTARELENGETSDEVWNTIMDVIRREGWVHNQLRMYWGKQILRWTNTPDHAFRTLLELNNRYFLDGRDANSFANVAWCFGRHDQGFQERDVIGKIRPFTDQALKRKGDLDAWVEAHRE